MTNAPTAPRRRYMTTQQALRSMLIDLVGHEEEARRQAALDVPESFVVEGSEIIDENIDRRLDWLTGAAWAIAQLGPLEDKLDDAEEALDEAKTINDRLEQEAEDAEDRVRELTARVAKLNEAVRYLEATGARGEGEQS